MIVSRFRDIPLEIRETNKLWDAFEEDCKRDRMLQLMQVEDKYREFIAFAFRSRWDSLNDLNGIISVWSSEVTIYA